MEYFTFHIIVGVLLSISAVFLLELSYDQRWKAREDLDHYAAMWLLMMMWEIVISIVAFAGIVKAISLVSVKVIHQINQRESK